MKLDNVANTPTVTWTVDTQAADNISSNATGVHVVGAEIGATLEVEVNGKGQASLQKVTGSPLDLAASSFGISADGDYKISLRQMDAAGNSSGWSTPVTLTYDTQAPQVTQRSEEHTSELQSH